MFLQGPLYLAHIIAIVYSMFIFYSRLQTPRSPVVSHIYLILLSTS